MQDLFRRLVGRMLEQYATVLFVLTGVATITYFILTNNEKSPGSAGETAKV